MVKSKERIFAWILAFLFLATPFLLCRTSCLGTVVTQNRLIYQLASKVIPTDNPTGLSDVNDSSENSLYK